ncbi:MAG: glycoside hydrolase family 16 protein [Clostridiales bacterium]|nr:glycoside hydrolase family 16 protein [Clostridiales bacterium]
MKRSIRYAALVMAAAMAMSACAKEPEATAPETAHAQAETTVDETTAAETEATETEAEVTEATEAPTPTPLPPIEDPNIEPPEGYYLVWHDEFDGDELDSSNWAGEYHRPGWVNNELQTYVVDGDNYFVEDGDLVIQPLTGTNDNGRAFYTSGRINTYHLHAFTYGRVEARIRVPQGQGFLPAFWMMSDDESYGSWPKSGEIDIMEILGSDTDTLYGTLHYGNPHMQNQGIYDLSSGDFASEYHVFAVEWEPGEIRWYCDDVCYYSTSYWYSAMDGQEPNEYPAPFNQPFYIILNVAVGGNWPGDPDETTLFDESAQMRVDYVRVFQRDAYDDNVTCPDAPDPANGEGS